MITTHKKTLKWGIIFTNLKNSLTLDRYSTIVPVNNFVFVKILQPQYDAGRVEDGPGLGEDVGVDVHHQVAAGRVLHHEADVRLGLK